MELYAAEPVALADLSGDAFARETRLAGRPFQNPEEEFTALILDELGVPWLFEAVAVIQHNERGRVIAKTTIDFYLPRYGVFIEVKGQRVGSRRQRRLARKAGYGLAYVLRLREVDHETRRSKIQRAIDEAQLRSVDAEHRARSGGSRTMSVVLNVRMRLTPI